MCRVWRKEKTPSGSAFLAEVVLLAQQYTDPISGIENRGLAEFRPARGPVNATLRFLLFVFLSFFFGHPA